MDLNKLAIHLTDAFIHLLLCKSSRVQKVLTAVHLMVD